MQATKNMTLTLTGLLQSEEAATETYQEALNYLGHAPGALDLQRIHEEHREAANSLRRQIREAGEEPDASSGPCSGWTLRIMTDAQCPGPRLAAQVLKVGEESGARDYEKALQNEYLPTECKMLIHNQLLPHTREHIATLDRILDVL